MTNKNIWENLFNEEKFQEEMKVNGYSKERKFIDYLNKYNIISTKNRPGAYTAQNLSIDFYSKQSKYLTEKEYYIIRTGKGKFIIFDKKRFNKPYLDLNTEKFEEIQIELPTEANFILKIYKENFVENAALEILHYVGGYKYILSKESKCENYYIGPRGNTVSKFDVYMFDKKLNENKYIFQYDGQEDLDYTLVTNEEIFIIEGKSLINGGLDLGYHKIIFPASRFKEISNKKIVPCYYLKHKEEILFYVFPEVKFFENGIILNDENNLKPLKLYKINLKKLFK